MEKERILYYFRMLTDRQYEEFLSGGDIVAQDPDANLTVEEHVAGGRHKNKPTQYISSTKSFAWCFADRRFNDKSISAIIRIAVPESEIDNLGVIDISTDEGLDKAGVKMWRNRNDAKAAREVLFTGIIPRQYCTLVCGRGIVPTELPEVDRDMVVRHTFQGFTTNDCTRTRIMIMRTKLDEIGLESENISEEEAQYVVEQVAVMRLVNDAVPGQKLSWWSSVR